MTTFYYILLVSPLSLEIDKGFMKDMAFPWILKSQMLAVRKTSCRDKHEALEKPSWLFSLEYLVQETMNIHFGKHVAA